MPPLDLYDVGFVGAVGADDTFDLSKLVTYNKGDVASSPDTNVSTSGDTFGTASDLICTNAAFREGGILDYSIQYGGAPINSKSVLGTSTSQFNFIYSETFEYSINVWYEKLTASPNAQSMFMMDRGSATSGLKWKFDDRSAHKKFEFSIKQSGASIVDGYSTTLIPQDDDFHMLTLTGNYSTPATKLYLDAGTAEDLPTTLRSGTNSADLPLQFAQEEDSSYWAGKLCEVSIWNRVLSSGEIDTLWNDGDGLAL